MRRMTCLSLNLVTWKTVRELTSPPDKSVSGQKWKATETFNVVCTVFVDQVNWVNCYSFRFKETKDTKNRMEKVPPSYLHLPRQSLLTRNLQLLSTHSIYLSHFFLFRFQTYLSIVRVYIWSFSLRSFLICVIITFLCSFEIRGCLNNMWAYYVHITYSINI